MANSCIISQKHWTEGKTIKTQDSKSHTCQTFFFPFGSELWNHIIVQIQRKQRRQKLEQLRRRQKSNIIFFLHDGWLHFESESGLTVFHSRSLNGIKKKAACILSWSMIFKWIKFFAIQEAWHCYKFILNALPCKSNQSLVWISLKLQTVVRMICRN